MANVKTILGVVVALNLIAVFCFFKLSTDPTASSSAATPGSTRRGFHRTGISSVQNTNNQYKSDSQSQNTNNIDVSQNKNDPKNDQSPDLSKFDDNKDAKFDTDLPVPNDIVDDHKSNSNNVKDSDTTDNKNAVDDTQDTIDDTQDVIDDLSTDTDPQGIEKDAPGFLVEPPKDNQPSAKNDELLKNEPLAQANETSKSTTLLNQSPQTNSVTIPTEPKVETKNVDTPKEDSNTPAHDDLLTDPDQNNDDYDANFLELEKKVIELNDIVDVQREYINALNPFRVLGFYKELELKYFDMTPKSKPYYDSPHTGLKKNPSYCDYNDLYNLFNPSNLYDNMHFLTDYDQTLVRTHVMTKIGEDTMPEVSMGMVGFREPIYDLDLRATMFFTKKVDFHFFQEIGKQFLCVSQMYNHIPGNGIITRKDLLVGAVNAYSDNYSQNPKCFNKKTFFPYAYRLYNKTECEQFFNEINDQSYFKLKEKNPLNYILKRGYGAHRASGVFLFDEAEERRTRKDYGNGSLCGKVEHNMLAQKYIENPLLLDRHNKFDFRMYMLIASVNPLIVYYHDGFLRVSLETYDQNSTDRNVHLTNTHLSKQKFNQAKNETLEAEMRDYQMWTLEQLQTYLLKIGKINDTNWLDNYLRPMFKKAYLHLIRMSRDNYWNHSSVYEMFGLDFMLDDNLGLWLIEVNASPQLVGTSPMKEKLMVETLSDLFEIQYAYLRSKVKRLYAIVHRLQANLYHRKPFDLEETKKEFARANTNFLEPEWQIRSNISWLKILDENIPGKQAYMGILEDECILDR